MAAVDFLKGSKVYLIDLHKGNEAKRAERKYERFHIYSKVLDTNWAVLPRCKQIQL